MENVRLQQKWLPAYPNQANHSVKVAIIGHEWKILLCGNRSNPNVDFSDPSACLPQSILDMTLMLVCHISARQDSDGRTETCNPYAILNRL